MQTYQLKFEELKSLMLILNPHLTKAFFVSSFISGLSEELRPMVKMLKPRTIKEAAESNRLQDMTVEAVTKQHQLLTKIHPANNPQLEGNPNHRGYTNLSSANSLLVEQK